MSFAARRLPIVLATVLWALTIRLGWALFTSDLTIEYVASHSRRSAPWWYRIAGMWGGVEGSLLLFATIVATVVAVAISIDRRGVEGGAAPNRSTIDDTAGPSGSAAGLGAAFAGSIGVAALLGIVVTFAWPFERLDVPAVEGFGLTPILEHPAMAIHPPLLYASLACTVPPLLGIGYWRRWLLVTLAGLTAAMTLGGLWSYVEQGWGGYWAWDPVENASLAPWLAAIVAVHGARGPTSRRTIALSGLPGVIGLFGVASSRSGAVPSVHSFAEAGRIGWAFATVAVAAAVFLAQRTHSTNADGSTATVRSSLDSWRLTPVLLGGSVLALVVLLTAVPLIATLNGRSGRLDGRWFAVLTMPFALIALGALAVLAVRARRQVPLGGWVAHVGIALLAVGITGSTFDRTSDGAIGTGQTAMFAGVEVRNEGLDVGDGPYPGTSQVTARLIVNGIGVTPSLVAYPSRGGVLAETALVTRPWRDIQVVLTSADDEGRALIEVRTKPLVQLIWLGALVVVAGATISSRRRPASLASWPAAR